MTENTARSSRSPMITAFGVLLATGLTAGAGEITRETNNNPQATQRAGSAFEVSTEYRGDPEPGPIPGGGPERVEDPLPPHAGVRHGQEEVAPEHPEFGPGGVDPQLRTPQPELDWTNRKNRLGESDVAYPYGEINIFDMLTFFDMVTRQDPEADLDGNGTVDVFDMIRFIAGYSELSRGPGLAS